MAYRCQSCGQAHEGLPLDIAFAKPGAYLALKTRQQKAKCTLSSELCVMGKKRFFIRGCVPMPVHETGGVFVWGLWAEVSAHVFSRYQQLFDADGTEEMPSAGALSVECEPLLRGMDRLPVLIRFGTAGRRPTFLLEPSNHWLCRDQQNGISLHRLHQMLHAMFPQHF
jgi:hypothetical protein